ncbi:hypothetical protein EDB86DRAFT_447906 [Lactarius hatsudake]|nr:hypothetical protein EDB86DRAFT_514291 [Lactarius hatsudake]KAH8981226.1 hypothetical protein EDB86DRAFT_447906 [Lactarius hatsudake]
MSFPRLFHHISCATPDLGLLSVNGHTMPNTGGGSDVLHTFEVTTHVIHPEISTFPSWRTRTRIGLAGIPPYTYFHKRTAETTYLIDHSPRRPPIHTHPARGIRCAHPPTRTGERPRPLGRRLQCGQQRQLGRWSRCRPNCWASQPTRYSPSHRVLVDGQTPLVLGNEWLYEHDLEIEDLWEQRSVVAGTSTPSTRYCFAGARARSRAG